jgi:hypothetical protein
MISAQRGWIGRLGEVALVRGFDPALGLAAPVTNGSGATARMVPLFSFGRRRNSGIFAFEHIGL